MWQLIINGPGYFDTAYELPEGETLLGRADENDVILSGDQVSRRHARFFCEDGKLFFEDLGSRNGTRVNGSFLVEPHEVSDGDVFTIGENSLAVRQPSEFEMAKTELLAEDDPRRAEIDAANAGGDKPFGEVLVSRSLDENPFIENIGQLDRFSVQDFEMMPFLDNFGSSTSTGDAQASAAAAAKVKAAKAAKKDKVPAREELLLFAQVSEKLNNSHSLHEFLDEVMGLIVEIAHASTGVALMFDDKGKLSPVVVRSSTGKVPEDMPISRSIVGEVAKKKAGMAVLNAQDDSNFASSESVIMYGLEQVICAPMLKGDELLGVIYLNRPAKPGGKSMPLPRLVDTVNALAHMLVSGIDKWSSREDEQVASSQHLRLACFHPAPVLERMRTEQTFQLGKLQKKCVTLVLINLEDLSAISAEMEPDKVAAILSDYYDVVRKTVFRFEGMLCFVQGAVALAAFGIPFSKENDADRAIICAQRCQRDCTALLHQMLPPDKVCDIKVTVNTGDIFVGPIGTPENFEYALLGDAVDLTRRLQTMDLSDALIVTESTLSACSGKIQVEALEPFRDTAGKRRVKIYEVVEELRDRGLKGRASSSNSGAPARKGHPSDAPSSGGASSPESSRPAAASSGTQSASKEAAVRSAQSSSSSPSHAVPRPASKPSLRSVPPLPSKSPGRAVGSRSEGRPVVRPMVKKSAGSASAGTVVATLPLAARAIASAAASHTPSSSASSRLPPRPSSSSLPPRQPRPPLPGTGPKKPRTP